MVYNEIKELLARYWEGETSLEEEEMLRNFFVAHQDEVQDMPVELKEAAPLFGYFVAEAAREIQETIVVKMVIPAATPAIPVSKPTPWQHWMKYAAMLLMAAGLTYSIQQFKVKHDKDELVGNMAFGQEDTYNDPEKAYAATKKALELLAKNLNKGTSQVQKIGYFNEATDMIKAN